MPVCAAHSRGQGGVTACTVQAPTSIPLVPGMHTARRVNNFNDTLKRDRQTGR